MRVCAMFTLPLHVVTSPSRACEPPLSTANGVNLSSGHSDSDDVLSPIIVNNRAITSLNISGNHLGDTTAYTLLLHIVRHGIIRNLNLSGTGITDAGALRIADVLPAAQSLRVLHITGESTAAC